MRLGVSLRAFARKTYGARSVRAWKRRLLQPNPTRLERDDGLDPWATATGGGHLLFGERDDVFRKRVLLGYVPQLLLEIFEAALVRCTSDPLGKDVQVDLEAAILTAVEFGQLVKPRSIGPSLKKSR
jgi:hypothetical protein